MFFAHESKKKDLTPLLYAYVKGNPLSYVDRLGLIGGWDNPGFAPNSSSAPLNYMHPESTTKGSSSNYSSLSKLPTKDIVDSLKPGSSEPLRVGPDGKIWDGNTRVKILEERGYDINRLPRTPYTPRGLACFGALSIVSEILHQIAEQKEAEKREACEKDISCRCKMNPLECA